MWNNADKFDHLISLAALKCTEEEAKKLNESDTSDVEFGKSYYRKRSRIIRKYRGGYKASVFAVMAVKLAAAAVIIVALLAVLIGCVPGLRQAIYDAVIEWYEEYLSIRFDGSGIPEKETEEDDGTPPTCIEEHHKPTNLPEGVWEDVLINTDYEITIDYYMGEEYLFSFSQLLLDTNGISFDNEGATVTYAVINGNNATVIEYETNSTICIVWNDEEYIYLLTTEVFELEELMHYAKSVK